MSPVTETPVSSDRYIIPGWFTRRVFNPIVASWRAAGSACADRANSACSAERRVSGGASRSPRWTSKDLATSWRRAAPRSGVRNLRAAGCGQLRVGRRTESFDAQEVSDADKVAILRAYLQHWKFEAGVFFDGVGPEAPDEQLLAIAHNHPVFRVAVS